MRAVSMGRIPKAKMVEVLSSIPFFRVLRQADENQFIDVMKLARLSVANPKEVVCRKGDYDSIMYFLLQGELSVYINSPEEDVKPISKIYPGEMFGTLAFLNDSPRNVTVQVSCEEKAVLMGIDFSPFGDLHDFSGIGKEAKKLFYHAIAKETERYLEQFSQYFPSNPRSQIFRSIQNETSASGDILSNLHSKCSRYADLLCSWNVEAAAHMSKVREVQPASHEVIIPDMNAFLFGTPLMSCSA